MRLRPQPFLAAVLVAVLFLSTGAPCALLELAGGPLCTTEATQAEEPEDPEPTGLDCCTGCMTCCARFLRADAPLSAGPPEPAAAPSVRPARPSLGSCLPIWRPPRA